MAVLIITEHKEGKIQTSSLELLSYGNELAKKLNLPIFALITEGIDEEEIKKLSLYGADKILQMEHPLLHYFDSQAYTSAIAQVTEKINASFILFEDNNKGKAVAPRLSIKLKAGIISGAIAFPKAISPFKTAKMVLSNKAIADIVIDTEIKIITLVRNSFKSIQTPKEYKIEKIAVLLSEEDIKTKLIEVKKAKEKKISLNDADIVVSAGRGMKGPENWHWIEELAAELKAATACSRPVADEGWRNAEEHVGQTGKVISPNLYIAIGISGAIQHIAGVSTSKYIVAINTDKEAPIFKFADYGINDDAFKVLPKLINTLKENK